MLHTINSRELLEDIEQVHAQWRRHAAKRLPQNEVIRHVHVFCRDVLQVKQDASVCLRADAEALAESRHEQLRKLSWRDTRIISLTE